MRQCSLKHVKTDSNTVYLTFDDGPEPGITEFVLDLLDHYGFKATFFCTGKCAEKYPDLMRRIEESGHLIGNHTYSHIKAYDCDSSHIYIEDVVKADRVLHTQYFRPPNGCLTLPIWMGLRKYNVIYWTIGSNDWCHNAEDFEKGLSLLEHTKPGDIILFHFCEELQKGTRAILPRYLRWLKANNYTSHTLTEVYD